MYKFFSLALVNWFSSPLKDFRLGIAASQLPMQPYSLRLQDEG